MNHVIMSGNGEITIPESIISKLKLKAGDELDFRISGDDVTLLPVIKSAAYSGKTFFTIEEMNNALKGRI